MGLGLIGARRLMDHFNVQSSDKGTTVDLCRELPAKTGRVTQAKLSELVADLKRDNASDPLAALRQAQLEVYRNPGQVSDLLRGNAPKFSGSTKPLPKTEVPPKGERTATRLWAAFVLSGAGR